MEEQSKNGPIELGNGTMQGVPTKGSPEDHFSWLSGPVKLDLP